AFSEQFYQIHQIRWRICLKRENLAAAGMAKAQPAGVQHLPSEGFDGRPQVRRQGVRLGREAGSVDVIADERVPDMREMHADLMGAARLQPAGEERGARAEALRNGVVRQGMTAAG